MFVFNCVALSIFMSITLVLFIKKEYIFGKLTILPTIAVAFFTVLQMSGCGRGGGGGYLLYPLFLF